MAKVFKIPDHEKLSDSKYKVFYKDITKGLRSDNIVVCTASEGAQKYVVKRFNNTCSESEVQGSEGKMVPDFPNYVIYSNGVIKLPNGKYTYGFSGYNNKIHLGVERSQLNTYRRIGINNSVYSVHRLVCYAFHPIYEYGSLVEYSHLDVDHIDHNKSNNNSSNLRWVTKSDNVQAAIVHHQYKKSLPVKQFTLNMDGTRGELIEVFSNIYDAHEQTKYSLQYIHKACMKQVYPQRICWFEFDTDAVTTSTKRPCSSEDEEQPCNKVQRISSSNEDAVNEDVVQGSDMDDDDQEMFEDMDDPVFDDHDVEIVPSSTSFV